MFRTNGENYKNLADYVYRAFDYFPVENIFITLKEKDEALKNNYKGIYHFTLVYYNRKVDYEYVCVDNFVDEKGKELLVLTPILFPDMEIFKYINPDKQDERIADIEVSYQPYYELNYKTDQYHLVNFYGLIEPIYVDDLYITENGINYKISTNDFDKSELIPFAKKNMDKELLVEMENDSFLGVYKETYIFNTGKIIEQKYTINDGDQKNLYFKIKEIPTVNSFNVPATIPIDNEGNIMVVIKRIGINYIPFMDCYTV